MSTGLPDTEAHAALQVSYPERKEQVRQISTLPTQSLLSYLKGVTVLSAHAQARLLQDPRNRVRNSLAAHAHLLPSNQARLAQDSNYYVRRVLASNPCITLETALLLIEGEHVDEERTSQLYVLQHLAGNPKAPLSVLHQLRERYPGIAGGVPLALLANSAFPLSEFGAVEDLNDYQQFVAAKRSELSYEDFLRFRVKNVHPYYLDRSVSDSLLVGGIKRLRKGYPGTLGELLEELKSQLSALNAAGRDTALKLEPDWEGTWAEPLSAAYALTT